MAFDEIRQRIVYVLTRKDKTEDDDTDIYVGSTSQNLGGRFMGHVSRAKNFIKDGYSENNRLYARMNEIGLDNWEILPLLAQTCDIKTIREVEKNWVRILKADLNTRSPVTDQKEYRESRKDAKKDYDAAYYKKNKEKVSQQHATYRENNRALVRQCILNSQRKAIERKKYYCNVCDVICTNNFHLKKHLNTLKHSYTWLNSVD